MCFIRNQLTSFEECAVIKKEVLSLKKPQNLQSMKKMLFIAAIASLCATSCAKDRVCTCTGSNGKPDITTLVGVTNGQAKANCVSMKYDDGKGGTETITCKLD